MDILSVFPIQFLHGLVYGMLLFLVASGLTLLFVLGVFVVRMRESPSRC